jgi:hypothetical protein
MIRVRGYQFCGKEGNGRKPAGFFPFVTFRAPV